MFRTFDVLMFPQVQILETVTINVNLRIVLQLKLYCNFKGREKKIKNWKMLLFSFYFKRLGKQNKVAQYSSTNAQALKHEFQHKLVKKLVKGPCHDDPRQGNTA